MEKKKTFTRQKGKQISIKIIKNLINFRYCSLLEQYLSSSYGDHNFANVLLIPLQLQFDKKYRRAVWTEYCEVLRMFPLPLKQVSYDIKTSYFFWHNLVLFEVISKLFKSKQCRLQLKLVKKFLFQLLFLSALVSRITGKNWKQTYRLH